jgi:hypothetical protein
MPAGTALADKPSWSIDSTTPALYVSPTGCFADVTVGYSYASTGRLQVEAVVDGVSQDVQGYDVTGNGTATTTLRLHLGGGSALTFITSLLKKQGQSETVQATSSTPPRSSCPASPAP